MIYFWLSSFFELKNFDKKDFKLCHQILIVTSPAAIAPSIACKIILPVPGSKYAKARLGKVVKTTDFGAFVNFLGSRDGLVHISQLKDERVEKTTDVVKEGDQVKVKVIGVDDRGKVKLSIKDV